MSGVTIAAVAPGAVLDDAATAGLTVADEGDKLSNQYDIGDGIRLTADFTNDSDVAANPTTVTCTLLEPDDTVTELSVTGPSPTGHYYATHTIAQAGKHRYRYEGTGALVVAEEGSFSVRKRKVPAA